MDRSLRLSSNQMVHYGMVNGCVPIDVELKRELMREAHETLYSIHPGSTKMYKDLKEQFWWNGMKKDVVKFVSRCLTYQLVKDEHQRPSGLLQSLDVPKWKWEHIAMDFVCGLSKTSKGYNSIWVIVDRLTKSVRFLPMKMTFSLDRLAKMYIDEIVRLHGTPIGIVLDRDVRLTLKFWMSLQQALGMKLNFNIVFHP